MTGKTAKLISADRVAQLLECYGANENNWPEDERAAATNLIKHSSELQQRQREAQQLDAAMNALDVNEELRHRADAKIVSNIMDNLPAQEQSNIESILYKTAANKTTSNKTTSNKTTAKNRNFFGAWIAYGMAAAAAVVFVTTVIMTQQLSPTQPTGTTNIAQTELDNWMWDQVEGSAAQEDNNEEPLTLMALVDLEMMPVEE